MKLNHDRATLIADGVRVDGDITFRDHLYVEGSIHGNVTSVTDNAVLVIGKKGSVEGNVDAKDVAVNGKVIGKLNARGDVQLARSAMVDGDVCYGTISIEQHAVVNGRLTKFDEKAKNLEATPMRVVASADVDG